MSAMSVPHWKVTTMSDAPERITVHLDRDGNEEWTASLEVPVEDVDHWDVEYVRADLHVDLKQKRDRLQMSVNGLVAKYKVLEQDRDRLRGVVDAAMWVCPTCGRVVGSEQETCRCGFDRAMPKGGNDE